MSLTIITPTIGSKYLKDCMNSVKNQTNQDFTYYIVLDGSKYTENCYEAIKGNEFPKNFQLLPLIENTGSNGWNGHKIYIAMAYLTNSEYLMFLDEDNTLEPTHVESMMKLIKEKKLDWAFSLRNIIDKDGKYICQDNCESLGNLNSVWNNPNDYLVDVNCYCVKRELFIKHCHDFYKKARPENDIEVDRALYKSLQKYNNESSRKHTVNYRVGNRPDSVKAEFFLYGNRVMEQRGFKITDVKTNESKQEVKSEDKKEIKQIYIFHLDQNWTDKAIKTNEFDYDSRRYLYEDGNKSMLYPLKKKYELYNGYTNNIPSGAVCFFTVMDIRLFPREVLMRNDIKKICYLLEGPNSWHNHNYDFDILSKFFTKIITYWDGLLNKPNVEYFPFVSRFDMTNKWHKEAISTKRKYDKSIGMILANRSNNEVYEINGIKLKRLDYMRKEIVLALDNVTVHGQGWDEIKNHTYVKVENITNRMNDDVDIYQFNSKFNFTIIIENCDGKNYVSEKIYDSWAAGCIPIYYGVNEGNKIQLPRDCYIDVKDYKDYNELSNYIRNLSKNDIDNYYENISKKIFNILESVSPNKLCEKIVELI